MLRCFYEEEINKVSSIAVATTRFTGFFINKSTEEGKQTKLITWRMISINNDKKFQPEHLELSRKLTKLDKEMSEHNKKIMTDLSTIEKNLADVKKDLEDMNNKINKLPNELEISEVTNKHYRIYLVTVLILYTVFTLLWIL